MALKQYLKTNTGGGLSQYLKPELKANTAAPAPATGGGGLAQYLKPELTRPTLAAAADPALLQAQRNLERIQKNPVGYAQLIATAKEQAKPKFTPTQITELSMPFSRTPTPELVEFKKTQRDELMEARNLADAASDPQKVMALNRQIKQVERSLDAYQTDIFYRDQEKQRTALEKAAQAAGKTPPAVDGAGITTPMFGEYADTKAAAKYVFDSAFRKAQELNAMRSGAESPYVKYGHMTQREKDVLAYYVSKNDWASAEQYLKTLDRALNERYMEQIRQRTRETAEKYPVLGAVTSVASSFATPAAYFTTGVRAVRNALTDNYAPTDINSPWFMGAHVQQASAEGVQNAAYNAAYRATGSAAAADVAAFAASTGLSILNFGAKAVMGPLALPYMGAEAAGMKALEAQQQGATAGEAFSLATIAGIIEIATEKIPLDNLLRLGKSGANTIKAVLKQAGIEASEEMISQVANTVADIAIMGDKSGFRQYVNYLKTQGYSDKDATAEALFQYFVKDVGLAGLGGGISGSVVGSVTALYGNIINAQRQTRPGPADAPVAPQTAAGAPSTPPQEGTTATLRNYLKPELAEPARTPAMPEGMGAASNPYATTQRISEFYTNTLMNTDLLDEVQKAELDPRDYVYDSVSEKESVARAKERLAMDFYGEEAYIQTKPALESAEEVDVAMGILGSYARAGQGAGDNADMINWARIVYDKAHAAGTALQAFDKYSRTPEGAVIKAMQTIEGAVDELTTTREAGGRKVPNQTGQQIEKETKAVINAVRDEAGKAAEEIAQKLRRAPADGGLPVGDWASETGRLLAERLAARTTAPVIKPQPITTTILNDLVRFAEEHALPKRQTARPARSAIDRIRDYLNNRAFYTRAWNEAQQRIRERYAGDQTALDAFEEWLNSTIQYNADPMATDATMLRAVMEAALASDNKTQDIINKAALGDTQGVINQVYNSLASELQPSEADAVLLRDAVTRYVANRLQDVDTNKRLENMVKAAMNDIHVTLTQAAIKNKAGKASVAQQISAQLISKYGIDAEAAAMVSETITNKFYEMLSDRAKKRLETMLQPKETDRKSKGWFERLDELVNLGAFDEAGYRDVIRQKYGLPYLDNADIEKIYRYMQLSNEAQDDYDRRMWLSRATRVITDKLPSTKYDKVRTVRRIMMLLNPKTLISRNAGGNLIFTAVENLKDIPGTLIDIAVSKRTGQRSTSFGLSGLQAQAQGFKKGLVEIGKDIQNKVNTSPTAHEMNAPTMRNLQPTTTLTSPVFKAMENALNILLQAGDRPFYAAAYAQRMDELQRLGYDITAEENVLDATEYALDRVFQNNSALAKKAMKLRESMGVLGDIVLPFVQTPTNIFDKLLEYTPVGFAKAVRKWGTMTGTTWSQKQFVDTLARALTGTGILTLGYFLARAGLLTGRLPEDDKKAQAEKLAGKQEYAIRVGDKSYTYDWAAPIGALLATGADMYQAGVDKKGFVATLWAAAQAGLDSMFQQSYLEGLSQLFGYKDITQGFLATMRSLPASFIPTGFNQLAKVIDSTWRETYDPNPLKEALNRTLARVPGLSMTLQPKIATSGDDLPNFDGRPLVSNIFESFISPGYIGQNAMTKIDTEMVRLYNATGDRDVLPPVRPSKSFDVRGETITMTAKEYADFQRVRNSYIYKEVNKLLASDAYKKVTDAEQAELVAKITKDANEEAKRAIMEGRGQMFLTNDGAARIQAFVDAAGVSEKKAYEVFKAIEALQPLPGEDSVSRYQRITTIMRQDITIPQAAAIVGTYFTERDKDGNVTRESLLPYIREPQRLLAIYGKTQDSEYISMAVPSEFTADKVTYELTAAERELFKKTFLEFFNSRIDAITSDEVIKKLRSDAYEVAKRAVIVARRRQ
jgi:hypothetical protein